MKVSFKAWNNISRIIIDSISEGINFLNQFKYKAPIRGIIDPETVNKHTLSSRITYDAKYLVSCKVQVQIKVN